MEQLRTSQAKLDDPSVEGYAEKQLIDIVTSLELQLEELGGGSDEEAALSAPLDTDAPPYEGHSNSADEDSQHEESQDPIPQAAEADGEVQRLSPGEHFWSKKKRKHDNIIVESEEAKEQRRQKHASECAKKELRHKTANLKKDVEKQIDTLLDKLEDPCCDGAKRQQMEKLLSTLRERLVQLRGSQIAQKKTTRWNAASAESGNKPGEPTLTSSSSSHTASADANDSHPQSISTSTIRNPYQREPFRRPPCDSVSAISRPRPSCAPGLAPH